MCQSLSQKEQVHLLTNTLNAEQNTNRRIQKVWRLPQSPSPQSLPVKPPITDAKWISLGLNVSSQTSGSEVLRAQEERTLI